MPSKSEYGAASARAISGSVRPRQRQSDVAIGLIRRFDKHFGEQSELVDLIAERIMVLGGVSLAIAADVAETTLIPRRRLWTRPADRRRPEAR